MASAENIASEALSKGYNISLETGPDGSSKMSAVAPDHFIRNAFVISAAFSAAVIVIIFVVKWLFPSGGRGYGGTIGPVEGPGGSSASDGGVNSAGSQVAGNLTSDMRSGDTTDNSTHIDRSIHINMFRISEERQETKIESKVGDDNESGLGPQ
jgi:hypothetical protein